MHVNTDPVRTMSRLLMLLLVISLCLSCRRKFPCTPAGGTACAITIDNFLEGCYTTVNGTVHIPYKGDLVIWYYDDCTKKKEMFNSYPIVSPNTPQKQPITINAMVPDKGPYQVEVTIEGLQCALCASGWGGTSDNNTNHCNAENTPTGKTAAYPKWNGLFGVQTVGPTLLIPRVQHVLNVPNSCGCPVPN